MRVLTRAELELAERERLSPDATFASDSLGRRVPEEPDALRTCFQCDRDRILHSKSFRRLAHKTQVFLAPEGDHYRTRLIHTLEVSQVARSIARPLGLNEDLTEAIALGHDLGHTPFGHVGERALSHALARHRGEPEGAGRLFAHNDQGARIVDLMSASRQNETVKTRNPWISAVIFVVGLGAIIVAYARLLHDGLPYDGQPEAMTGTPLVEEAHVR